jgi:hypothetical protein
MLGAVPEREETRTASRYETAESVVFFMCFKGVRARRDEFVYPNAIVSSD